MTDSISVIIVNYNGAKFIADCIHSVLASELSVPFEIIVVDNHSQDASSTVLDSFNDQIRTIYNPNNEGFSYANNQAAKIAMGNFLFLLNNDTVIEKDTIQILYDFIKKHPEAGALSPKLIGSDGKLQCPGSFFGAWRFYAKRAIKVPFIAGAAVMMNADFYREIGGLDPNLFFYNDDVDLCMTLRKKKRPIYYVPESSLIHFGGLSTKFRFIGSHIEGFRGGLYIAKKHYANWIYVLYRFFVFIYVSIRLMFAKLCRSADQIQLFSEVLDIVRSESIYIER